MNAITAARRVRRRGLRRRRRRRSRPSRSEPARSGAQVYDAVTTKAGRYVQGGGCLTVGVAGLVQSGGFGSFSKALRHGGGEPAGGRDRHRGRRGAHRQRLHEPGAVLGAQGRRRRQPWRRDAADAAQRMSCRSSSARLIMAIKATSDAAFRRLIGRIDRHSTATACSIRTGASRSPSGRDNALVDLDGVPGARPAAGGSGLAAVPRLGGRRRREEFSFEAAPTVPRRAGAAVLGPRRF